jgi:hypothetical protein
MFGPKVSFGLDAMAAERDLNHIEIVDAAETRNRFRVLELAALCMSTRRGGT